MKKIILASNSPRRKEILKEGNIKFTVVKSNYEEEHFETYNVSYIKRNSLMKALDVAQRLDFDAVVIGADTMVILDSVCLLKPVNYDEAFSMLKRLSGRVHSVVTSISLVDVKSGKNLTETVETLVTMRELTDEEIKKYLDDFKPFDKAGSYGIQDFMKDEEKFDPPKSSFISKIEGDYLNVMGLSLEKTREMLEKFSY